MENGKDKSTGGGRSSWSVMDTVILILLVVFAYYVTIPLLVLGLFLGFRYRFSGPDLEREDLNHVMGSVADTAADLGRQVMDELRSQSGDASGEVRRAQREVEDLERQAADLERRVEQDLLNGRGGDKK